MVTRLDYIVKEPNERKPIFIKKSHDIEIKSKIVFSSIVAFLHDLEYTANDR